MMTIVTCTQFLQIGFSSLAFQNRCIVDFRSEKENQLVLSNNKTIFKHHTYIRQAFQERDKINLYVHKANICKVCSRDLANNYYRVMDWRIVIIIILNY